MNGRDIFFKNCLEAVKNSKRPLHTPEEIAVAVVMEYEAAGYGFEPDGEGTPLHEICNGVLGVDFTEDDVNTILETSVYESYGEIDFDFSKAISLSEVKQKLEKFKKERTQERIAELAQPEKVRQNDYVSQGV